VHRLTREALMNDDTRNTRRPCGELDLAAIAAVKDRSSRRSDRCPLSSARSSMSFIDCAGIALLLRADPSCEPLPLPCG
jgi:hypothetical protein